MESTEYNKYNQQRIELQAEIQNTVIEPISFEVWEKTPAEKQQLKDMKHLYKSKKG